MSRDASITFDWADGTYTFRLPIGQLRELQEKTGTGPLALFQRLSDGTWRFDDAREVIRLGLIGGGTKPVDALNLARSYCDERPLMDGVQPALAILGCALFGAPDEPVGKAVDPNAAQGPTSSNSPPSTEAEPQSD